MATTTVRVDERTHTVLRELSCWTHESMQSVLATAVEAYRRDWLLRVLNDHYDQLRSDPVAWADELEERQLWDNTLMDGLEDDPYPLDSDQLAAADAARVARALPPTANER